MDGRLPRGYSQGTLPPDEERSASLEHNLLPVAVSSVRWSERSRARVGERSESDMSDRRLSPCYLDGRWRG